MAFLELTGVQKKFGKQFAVRDFNLEVQKGEFVSFLGGSGCGKTTTLRMIAGFELPTAGRIRIGDRDVSNVPPNRRRVGMVFQNYALFPNLNVVQNIAFGLKVAGVPVKTRLEQAGRLLDMVHLDGFQNRYPHQLSGGQQQRVALARALAIQPQVLLLDEPLSALDAKIRLKLRQEIRALQKELGITTIYVTHDQEEALSLSDRIVVMREGRIEQVGTPAQIYHDPASLFVASFIGTLNRLRAEVADPAAGRLAVAGQVIRTGGVFSRPKGEPVCVALRPERLSLERRNDDDNCLSGILSHVTLLGAIVRWSVRVGEQEIRIDTFNDPLLEMPPAGQTVRVYFPEAACRVMEDSEVAAG
ncbi:putative spermidine/putrescine transport system ATP-binding protein [Hydrogenispora ethanolica]|uniref:ABC-type quaternary amine transporter n=1 Tax=Hydrogenispora ethanolica TaxID=1082276 RepID=A0A4V2QCZ1_HYDET|nr:ABC transporter ATP-binding protein [Hydrogenispora ethanolica]TCL62327.1 putative spermidine/putrescine transport system ATP-binding protein [Hydrogenispora ethanolica]